MIDKILELRQMLRNRRLSRDELEQILATGVFRRAEGDKGFIDAWLSDPDEVPPLMAEGGFEQLDLIHCEPLVCEMEDKINEAPDELHQQWLDLLYRLCRDPAIRAGGGHILYVGRARP